MNQRLPVLRPRHVLRALQRAGFFVHHTTGSHHLLKHPDKPHLRVTLLFHNKDLKRRTLAAIRDQVGLTAEDFQQFLSSDPALSVLGRSRVSSDSLMDLSTLTAAPDGLQLKQWGVMNPTRA
jgi:predicted RNA binding protein YcfA (HicA-like mRNA interferase family)